IRRVLRHAFEPRSLLVIEPEEPDGTRACMRSDDRPEVGHDLDLRLRPFTAHHLLELSRTIGRLGVCDSDAKSRAVIAARGELLDEELHRLLTPAHALERNHLALDRQYRLDVQEVAC